MPRALNWPRLIGAAALVIVALAALWWLGLPPFSAPAPKEARTRRADVQAAKVEVELSDKQTSTLKIAAVGEVLRAGNVSLDTQSRQVNIGAHVHAGRLRETLILEILLRYSGQVVKRDFLFNQLYGFDAQAEPSTVDVHIHRLRRHLAHRGATVTVHTIRGVGFMLTAQPPSPAADQASSQVGRR